MQGVFMHYALKGKYPIETLDQLTKTAEYFDKFITRFAPQERVFAARNIEKRASELDTYIDRDWIKNYSRSMNNNASVSPEFHKNMELRKRACLNKTVTINGKQFDAVQILNKIESEIDKHGALIVVDELTDFDKLAGIEYQWDKSILDPIMTVYGSAIDPEFDAVKVAGNYTNYDIKKLASETDVLGLIAKRIGNKEARKFFKDPIGVSEQIGTHGAQTISSILDEKKKSQ
jgi:hypothetical protein